MNEIDFYRQQIAAMRDQAASAVLPQVKERCERAADAWQAMVDKAEEIERCRRTNDGSEPKLRPPGLGSDTDRHQHLG